MNSIGKRNGRYLTFIPSSTSIKRRLQEIESDAAKLRILLRTAEEIEALQTADQSDEKTPGNVGNIDEGKGSPPSCIGTGQQAQ